MDLKQVIGDAAVKELAFIADEIWHEFFPSILSEEQIDYMVEKFQSFEAMTNQIDEGYEYFFIEIDGVKAGYMGIHEDVAENKMFLSKLYLKKDFRNKGYAGKVLRNLFSMAKERNLNKVWLTVNKYNDHTIAVYEHMGFVKARTQVADIGNGFVMDDIIMEKTV